MKTEILLQCNNEDLPFYEKQMIQAYDTFGPNGYNQTSGGEIGKEYTQEIRKKISDKLKEGWKNGTITHHAISKEVLIERKNKANGSLIHDSKRNKYIVYIPGSWCTNGLKKFIGRFDSKEEAMQMLERCKNEVQEHDNVSVAEIPKLNRKAKAGRRPKGCIDYSYGFYRVRIPGSFTNDGKRKVIARYKTRSEAEDALQNYRTKFIDNDGIRTRAPEGNRT